AGRYRTWSGRQGRPGDLEGSDERGDGRDRESASPAPMCRRRQVPHWQQPTQPLATAQTCPIWSGPRVPSALSATSSPRDGVCAVPYSQLSPEPPIVSSMHCWSGGAVESIAQKAATVMAVVSWRPLSGPFVCARACNSWYVHACVHMKAAVQAASA